MWKLSFIDCENNCAISYFKAESYLQLCVSNSIPNKTGFLMPKPIWIFEMLLFFHSIRFLDTQHCDKNINIHVSYKTRLQTSLAIELLPNAWKIFTGVAKSEGREKRFRASLILPERYQNISRSLRSRHWFCKQKAEKEQFSIDDGPQHIAEFVASEFSTRSIDLHNTFKELFALSFVNLQALLINTLFYKLSGNTAVE